MSLMSNYFQAMADKIRSKTGKTDLMTPEQMIPELHVVYNKGREDYISKSSLKFSSDGPFTLKVNSPKWNNIIKYSLDNGDTWNTWDGSQLSGTVEQSIYLRGIGNNKITGYDSDPANCAWTFTGKYCTGNIETLLDYQTVVQGQHPAMTANCYYGMFRDCTSLVTPPELPAITLKSGCYHSMFYSCTSLTITPELPATTLAEACYDNMFASCTSLIAAPELPATTLARMCYNNMFGYDSKFRGCTSLVTLPELPATTLAGSCYEQMFGGCASLKLSTTQTGVYQYPYRIPTSGTGTGATEESRALRNMFLYTSGTVTGTPEINTTYYTDHQPVVPMIGPKFSSDKPFTLSVVNPGWNGTIEYTLDKGNTWSRWDGSELNGTAEHPIYLRGTGNTKITGGINHNWTFTGKYCTGNIEVLLDYQTVANGQHPTMEERCYEGMFSHCTSLIAAPELPATTLIDSCYEAMFQGCRSLTTPPQLLATTLAEKCCIFMFQDCVSLTIAPKLPATTLADHCYEYMFFGCDSLTTLPKLPATTLAGGCYASMFARCTSIKLSTSSGGIYRSSYRIPTSGTGTNNNSLGSMFDNTGGTFTGTPTVNTTYYTDHVSV